ncbi:hypothetical protein Ahy_B05g073863 isoform C [Arachis hypogaea]|uniref:Auxin response factor domain-containing protein n=1 Tax=Arachis hypogaea TaxID=3818 RepID=A0A444YX95_ARAHY|nr:hypothetical protein Ahy_B05g073863 isoform C [Arachis hypogaea]
MVILTTITTSTRQLLFGAEQQCLFFIFFLHLTQRELWHACVDPLVTVPREGERVFYFPQGHIEQEEASTNQVADQHMPVYDLPSKILCRVINVQLKAEPDTDEQDENAVDKEPPLPPRCRLLPCTLCLHLDKWSLRELILRSSEIATVGAIFNFRYPPNL